MQFTKVREGVWELAKEGSMRVPVRAYAESEEMLSKMMSDRTLMQAKNVSMLPGILSAAFVMPDGHEGYGFPIGGVAAFDEEEGVVSPGGVGYDINCGVRLLKTNLSEADVKPRLRELVQSLFKNVPSGVGSKSRIRATEKELEEATRLGVNWAIDKGYGVKEDREHCEENGCFEGSDFSKVSEMARKRGAPQMGTLGSGNHFLEIQKIERVFDPETAKALGVFEGQITVMIHSGSRGFGHQVCDDFVRSMPAVAEKNGVQLPDRELVCAPIQSKEAQDYLGAMRCAINYAFLNRQFMTHWTRECFEQVFKKKWDEMGMNLVYDVCHNIAKFEEHEVEGKNRRVCVHRKGATRAFWKGRKEIPRAYANLGQPVIIPGSMNTASYLLLGQEGAKECFGSSCHGAGRVMSRAAAIRQFGNQSIAKDMEKKGTLVQATEPRLLAEEFGGAYKNIDSVVSSVEKAGLCKIVARMVPLGVVKG